MKIKTPTEFSPFKDGVCNIFTIDEEEHREYKYKGIYFDNKVIGYKRMYAAKAAQSTINRVINIPNLNNIDNFDCIEIQGEKCYYTIEYVQKIDDSNPSSLTLTLVKTGI